ncbi:hypothetical protein CPC08DRAFT_813560 [Agrocybe pediades]|nr:hypothetical protein CPC08DRAFT_813560 [Agrocybe pediades]
MMVSLKHLETEPTRMGREEGIFKSTNKGSKRKGSLLLDMFYYPILQVPTCSNTSIVTLRIGQAKGLLVEGTDIHSEKKHSKLMVVTRMDWTSQPIHKSHEAYDVDEPSWNCSFDFLCFDKSSTTIVMKIVSKRWNGTHVEYGHVSLALNELVQADRDELGWWPLSGFPNGRLQVTADWKPIELHQDNIYKE